MKKKIKQKYPAGWDEERIRKLAEHHDNQTEDEQVAEIEEAEWRGEAEDARKLARRKGIDQAVIDRAVDKVRHRS